MSVLEQFLGLQSVGFSFLCMKWPFVSAASLLLTCAYLKKNQNSLQTNKNLVLIEAGKVWKGLVKYPLLKNWTGGSENGNYFKAAKFLVCQRDYADI